MSVTSRMLGACAAAFAAILLCASTSANRPGIRDLDAAMSKVSAAHELLLQQRPLNMSQFVGLLNDAHTITPLADRYVAAELRRYAILFAPYLGDADMAREALNGITRMDARLARDDTLRKIRTYYGLSIDVSPKRKAASRAGKPTPVVVVPYGALPADIAMPRSIPESRGLLPMSLPVESWPRILSRVPPKDPRGPGAPAVTITAAVAIGADGRVPQTISGLRSADRNTPPVQLESGPPELLAPAEEALRQWTFRPLLVLDRPVQSIAMVSITFGGAGATPTAPAPGPAAGTLPRFGEYVFTEELPEVITKVQPAYPEGARRSGVQGVVVVQALVDRDGRVVDTRVVKSTPLLDDAAVGAVRQWVFKPARTKGLPVAVWVAVPVKFP
jgi:protein TonB